MNRLSVTSGLIRGLLLLASTFCGTPVQAQDNAAVEERSVTPDDTLVFVGTYTGADSKGIYLFKQKASVAADAQQGALQPLGLAAETKSPSFLDIDADSGLVFAVSELDQFGGKPTGAVSAFAIDEASSKLTLLNQQPSLGTGPCHVALDRERRHVLVANYGSGSVTVLPIGADGRLGTASDFHQHAGKSVNPQRQEGPHAHCVTFDPAGRFVFVCDLGLDQILVYKFDAEHGKLTPNQPAFATVKPGAGPRHMAFRPDGRFAYVNNELDSTITVFAYDADRGLLRELQTMSTLPPDFDGENSTAEIAVHPSGKFVYVSNRGHNSIVAFAVDGARGTLSYIAHQSTGGKTPRNFELAPDGKFLIIANQDTNSLVVCQIDQSTGRLRPIGAPIESPRPVCIKFLTPKRASK